MIVKTHGLNLRETPDSSNDANIIAKMPLAHEVTVINAPKDARFWEVQTVINGKTKTGHASASLLREPLSKAKEKLIAGAVNEWTRFKFGEGQETDDPYYKYIGEYYDRINRHGTNGKSGEPWSAAFMSFIILSAGYTNFRFSNGHWEYIYDAKANADKPNAPFSLFKLDKHKPQLGDLVCAWRENVMTTFETVRNSFFPSHTDVIVEIREDSVRTIGGNAHDQNTGNDNTVGLKTFPLNDKGCVTAADRRFAIMRNNR